MKRKLIRNLMYMVVAMVAFFVTFYLLIALFGGLLNEFIGGFAYSAISLLTAAVLTPKVVKPWLPKTY